MKPMKASFQKGDREAGCRTFINYVLDDANAWDNMPEAARHDVLNHAREWDVMMTTGELFPVLEPQAVRRITAPVLLLSGEKSYRFLGLIDEELTRLLPHARQIILRGTTHRMWFEQPEVCRNAVLEFLREEKAGWKSPKLEEQNLETLRNRGSGGLVFNFGNYPIFGNFGNSPRLRVSAVKILSFQCLRSGFALNSQQPLRVPSQNQRALFF